MALGEEGLGEIVGPAGFGAFDLKEVGAQEFVGSLRFALLHDVGNLGEPLVDLVFIARIATEQEIVEIEAILHDLGADQLDGGLTFQSIGGFAAGRAGLPDRADIHKEENEEDQQDRPKAPIKLLLDGHCVTSSTPQIKSRLRTIEQNKRPTGAALLLEVEFDHLRRLFRRRFEFPFLDRVLARLEQDGVAPQGSR